MVTRISQWIDSAKRLFGKFTKEEIFSISRRSVSSHQEKFFPIDYDHCSRYLWKIFEDKEVRKDKVYDDSLILLSLWYLFDRVPKGKAITIRIGRVISELANGPEDVADCMSLEESKSHILGIAKKYFPERAQDIKIVDMEQEEDNKKLFSLLRETGIQWLESNQKQPELPQNITSLDIARYLYRVCKHNTSFDTWIKKLTPPENKIQTTEKNFPKYYGLIEIACRLDDLFHGTYAQWWFEAQNKYDEVIMTILGTRKGKKDFPELLPLQKVCEERGLNKTFTRIYVEKQSYKRLVAQKQDQKESSVSFVKKAAWTSLFTAALLGLFKDGYDRVQSTQKEKNQKKVSDVLYHVFQEQEKEKKILTIESMDSVVDRVYNYIARVYGTGGMSKERERILIKNELKNNYQRLKKFYVSPVPWQDKMIYDFLSNIFIPQNSVILGDEWRDILPFEHIMEGNWEAVKNLKEFKGNVSFHRRQPPTATNPITTIEVEGEQGLKANWINTRSKRIEIFSKIPYVGLDGKTYEIATLLIKDLTETIQKDNRQSRYVCLVGSIPGKNPKFEGIFSIDLGKKLIQEIEGRRQQAQKALDDVNEK